MFGSMALVIVILVALSINQYDFTVPAAAPEPEPSSAVSAEELLQFKRMRMLRSFLEQCASEQYPEWRCMVFAHAAGFTDLELTQVSDL